MVYRLDVILGDGTRRRANYDTDRPELVEIAKCQFAPQDTMLKGAACITTNPVLKKMLNENGFQTQPPGKRSNLCVRMDDVMADRICEIAQEHGRKEAAVVRVAVQYWLDHGAPMK